MLRLANVALHLVHLVLIAFSLVGWIWPETRVAHLVLAGGVALSWFAIGPLLGQPGLCIVTRLQHGIWDRLGFAHKPDYIPFLYERIAGRPAADPKRLDVGVQIAFYTTTALSLALLLRG